MVEGSQGEVTKEHYSDKGGHFLRGQYWRAQRLVSEITVFQSRSIVSIPVPIETSWQRRRFMLRCQRDGRR